MAPLPLHSLDYAEPVIHAEGLGFSYRPGHEVLHDIYLSLEPGSFTFLTGPSGSGKSSLLGLLGLALRPTRGELRMFGMDVGRATHTTLPLMRRRIGTVYQDFRLIEHLTVEENIGLPLKIMGEPAEHIRAKVHEMLAWVGLSEYMKARPEVLSGGQKQRIAIARAVIHAPDILLADEPSGNLDPALSRKFMYLFEALNASGTTILYATHDAHLVAEFPYPSLILEAGTLRRGKL